MQLQDEIPSSPLDELFTPCHFDSRTELDGGWRLFFAMPHRKDDPASGCSAVVTARLWPVAGTRFWRFELIDVAGSSIESERRLIELLRATLSTRLIDPQQGEARD